MLIEVMQQSQASCWHALPARARFRVSALVPHVLLPGSGKQPLCPLVKVNEESANMVKRVKK